MIAEIMTCNIVAGRARDEVIADCHRSAPTWRANPDFIRENDPFEPETWRAVGVCLPGNVAAARKVRGRVWRKRVGPA